MTTGKELPTGDRILDFLREKPGATVREVGEAVGLRSPASSFYQLGRLEEKGLLRRVNCPLCAAQMWTIIEPEEEDGEASAP